MNTEEQNLGAITEELRLKHGCHTVILYGSRARGDATEASDYDVAGVRAGGELRRDARLWNGIYLDVFVYPEKDLSDPHEGMLDMRLGRILYQEGDWGDRFFERLEKLHDQGPKNLRADEIEAILTWHEKALARIRAGGIQGNLRRAELLPALLEHFFTTRGEWYRGPKAALQWLKANRPELYLAFDKAFAPAAAVEDIEALSHAVNAEIKRDAKPAAPAAAGAAVADDMNLPIGGGFYVSNMRPSDGTAFVEHLKEKQIYDQTLAIPFPYRASDAQWWINHVTEETERIGRSVNWCIRREDGYLIGGIGFAGLTPGKTHRAEIGYWLAKPYWGKGIMPKAVAAVSDFAFRELGLRRITANVFAFNTGSARVLEKAGFEFEGCLRKNYEKNGKIFDGKLYAKLRPEE